MERPPARHGGPPQNRIHARGARSLSAHGRRGSARVLRPPARPVQGGCDHGHGAVDRAPGRGGAPRRQRSEALPGQPTTRPAGRGAGPRPRPARARRTVLRPGPRRGRCDERRPQGEGLRGSAGRLLVPPARSGRAAVRQGRHRLAGERRGRGHHRGSEGLGQAPARPGRHRDRRRARTGAVGRGRHAPPRPPRRHLRRAEAAGLRAALAAGPVREFGPRRPHLADLFKGVVVVAPQEEPRPARKGLFGRRRAV